MIKKRAETVGLWILTASLFAAHVLFRSLSKGL